MSKKIDRALVKQIERDIEKIRKADAKRQSEWLTDEDAINFLKQSPTYQYEIYRIRKELV